MIGCLEQPYSREGPQLYSVERILHKLTPDRAILHRWINRDWPEASYGRTLVDEVTADDRAVEFGDYRIEARIGKQASQQPTRDFLRRKIWREIVLVGDCLKSVVTDLTTTLGICSGTRSQRDIHLTRKR